MITAKSLLAAIDAKRADAGLTYKDVAESIGFHSALFTRLKGDLLPSQTNIDALVEWLGDDYSANCSACDEAAALAADGEKTLWPFEVGDRVRDASGRVGAVTKATYTHSTDAYTMTVKLDDGTVETFAEQDIEHDDINIAAEATNEAPAGAPVFAINAVRAHLSETEDPETKAAVSRVRELLAEGAVGVSVLLDIHPDDAAIIGKAEENWAAQQGEDMKPIQEFLPTLDWKPRQRVRHTAIVDTPAFSDARLAIGEDGSLTGAVTFEGIYTGDVRYSADPEMIDLAASRVPSPIIWDRADGDHSGMTVGYIEEFARVPVEGEVAGRPILDDEAITASLAPLSMPADYFATSMPTGPEPLRISQPDEKGFRTIRGLAASKGVCHRSAMACFTFPDDPDPKLSHFHTGTLLRLDNGKDIRVGAVTFGGHHLDPALAKEGVKIDQANNYRDNASTVFALVRAWPTRFGLMIAGVVPPDVSEAQVTRALACAPSVELWPRNGDGKRTLMGIHIVPRPAWPVMASVGSTTVAVSDEAITLEAEIEEETGEPNDGMPVLEAFDLSEITDAIALLSAKLDALSETASTILALTPIPDDIDDLLAEDDPA